MLAVTSGDKAIGRGLREATHPALEPRDGSSS